MRLSCPSAVIDDLRDRIRGIEAYRPRAGERDTVSTGFPALNRLLPGGGLPRGTLAEWTGDADGSGAVTLALAVAGHLLRGEGTLVVIDEGGDFYPVGAAQLAIPLDRTAVVRPDSAKSALWAWEQSLRCPGVAVTFGKIDPRNDRALRRLQMAAETGGGLGFLVPPPGSPGTPWATTRIKVEPARAPHAEREGYYLGRRLRVRVVRGQAGGREAAVELELSHEASAVSAAAELAGAMASRRPAVG
jgi:protein ImuA